MYRNHSVMYIVMVYCNVSNVIALLLEFRIVVYCYRSVVLIIHLNVT